MKIIIFCAKWPRTKVISYYTALNNLVENFEIYVGKEFSRVEYIINQVDNLKERI
ncbi:hypothetical protein [Mucilaginibacter sp. FT3.2]|uniref:hypothetical protein n=1 Tax=Mucilaginibacter sp. FT3.2 TaxID=2723090 RepID=UPI001610E3B1|nr:hypothetical protein [Mucilaginibacter sp. FT3.2]MBB6235321.1 hypothetical protein [Mucilaginibacter sp. FT3.2]